MRRISKLWSYQFLMNNKYHITHYINYSPFNWCVSTFPNITSFKKEFRLETPQPMPFVNIVFSTLQRQRQNRCKDKKAINTSSDVVLISCKTECKVVKKKQFLEEKCIKTQ